MLKFGLVIDFGVIQKSDAANFEILIFHNFWGVRGQNLVQIGHFWTSTPSKIAKNQNFKIAVTFCITPKSISRSNFIIIGLVDSCNNSILCQN